VILTNVTVEREENPRKRPFSIDLIDEETENDLSPLLATRAVAKEGSDID
jgi:hypothetical protein